nr:GNAT family N-acetyltransferase [Desulfospira joergensenii]
MYYRIIDNDIKVCLSVPSFSEDLFDLTNRNRKHLKEWLPWLDTIMRPEDTKAFIELQLQRFSRQEAIHQTIFYKTEIAGVLGFNKIDNTNKIGHLGYWLGKDFTGNGIMTKCVKDLIELGFEEVELQRIDIRCAVGNMKSRAIPERLSFENEGIIKRAEKVYNKYNDHVIYGLIK